MNTLTIQLKDGERILLNLETDTAAQPQDVLTAFLTLLNPATPQPPPKERVSGKYGPLADHLHALDQPTIQLTFTQIEQLLGFALPDSAHGHRAWWANDTTHSQARAWRAAGWQSGDVDLTSKTVKFIRSSQALEGDPMSNLHQKRVTIRSAGPLKSTTNGNEYVECDTADGTIAVWGSPNNRGNIERVQQASLPCVAVISCLPGRWKQHAYWVPETTILIWEETDNTPTP